MGALRQDGLADETVSRDITLTLIPNISVTNEERSRWEIS
jgi:hypothetical protein